MHCASKRIHFGNYVFDIYDDVYEPAEDSFLFAENLDVKEGSQVLDVGTGCGLLGILASKKAGGVVVVDLNPFAIRCARENSARNGAENKMYFVQASLFSALNSGVRFDLILFNAPYLPSEIGEDASWIGRSWAGGRNGREVVDRFLSEVHAHLNPMGKVMLMQSTITGVDETLQKLSENNLKGKIKAELKLPFFETLTLIEAHV